MKTTIIACKGDNKNSASNVASQCWPIWKFAMQLGAALCLLLVGIPLAQVQAQPVAYSIWNDFTVPADPSFPDFRELELGLKFRSAVDGNITGIRFYKGLSNPGLHTGSLWTSTGILLGSVQFENETPGGWQQQALVPPVAISANTTYVVSYHAPFGGYAVNLQYFATSGVDNYPLRALQDGEDGANGVFGIGPIGTFPDRTYNSANYWVDVVFTPTAPDTNPPTITCPADIILQCADCNTDPSNTGTATATDESGIVTVNHSDVVRGICPKVVKRTWTATDGAGNTASCVQTITCLPPSVVTDSSGCIFDRDLSSAVQDFRLIFIQDPQNWPCYRLAACNPGQFLYNVFYTGAPGQEITFNITLPYPFVTQGANPIHAYDWVTVTGDDTKQCLVPGNAFFASPRLVGITAYGETPAPFETIAVTLTVPASGVVYLAIHLDYGLKGASGFTRNGSDDAVDCATGATVLIPNNGTYEFSVAGAQTSSASIQNFNAFKKIPGVAGLALDEGTLEPVSGATMTLATAKHVPVGSAVTDEDGFYMIAYKHTGKAATYDLSIATLPPEAYTRTQTTKLKANAFVRVDFWVP